jgi:MFS family permease
VGAIGFGLYMQGDAAQSQAALLGVLVIAGLLWLAGAASFAGLEETPGATEGGGNAIDEALQQLRLIREDPQLRRFLLCRTLLISTALVAPFYVLLAQAGTEGSVAGLGLLIVAAGLADALSASVWGRLSDRSSRLVLVAAAGTAGLLGLLAFATFRLAPALAGSEWLFATVFFVLGIAHAGVRLGRKTYLVDMAGSEHRASYVAVSNTFIGVMLLVGGAFGFLAEAFGADAVVLILGLLSLAGAAVAWTMDEVQ